jgi:hypothetical protein
MGGLSYCENLLLVLIHVFIHPHVLSSLVILGAGWASWNVV